jgi:hypothetical protein
MDANLVLDFLDDFEKQRQNVYVAAMPAWRQSGRFFSMLPYRNRWRCPKSSASWRFP